MSLNIINTSIKSMNLKVETKNNTIKNVEIVKKNSLWQNVNARNPEFYKNKILQQLSNLQNAELHINDPIDSVIVLGSAGADNLIASIRFNDIDCYKDIALGGSNAAAEAYLQGRWNTDNLTNVIRIMARNKNLIDEIDNGLAAIATWLLRKWHSRNKNSKQGSKKNIAAHYDLGNDFFRLFLDEKMMYSSYIYETCDDLHQASTRKLHTICQQLDIQKTDHVLEIGSGWGGFACYAAKKYGCKVTTITISQEQYNEAVALVKKENLQSQVFVELKDYRDVSDQYDKVVSIEMIEAVGHDYLDTYFKVVANALKPDGQALIQAITVNDHRYEHSLKSIDYIKRYIFPGSFIPCVSVITQTAGEYALVVNNLLDIGQSYAITLKEWRERFFKNISKVREQGFDERFIRLWEFYLCYCEGGFLEKSISDVQIHFRKAD